jgi:O-antigen/teichoic acid export membrane protein
MSGVRQSILFSAADKYLSQILLISTTAVMARILTPAETGLYMTANAVIMLADNFRAFGVGIYIVQEKHLSQTLVRSAFTVTLVLSLAMGAAIYMGAGSVASFYASPELQTLLVVAALGFLAIPFSSPIMALLQRDMAFKAIASINIAAALTGAIITITLGLKGWGPVSYVWGSVGTSFLMGVLAFVAPLQMFVAYLFIRRVIDLTWTELARAARESAFLAVGTALGPVLVVATSPTGFDLGWVQTLIAVVGGATGWLTTLALVDHPLKQEIAGAWHFFLERVLRLRPVASTRHIAPGTKSSV